MTILWEHKQVVYQLATSHETWQKNYLSFAQVLQFVKGGFQNKMLLKPLARFIEVPHFDRIWIEANI